MKKLNRPSLQNNALKIPLTIYHGMLAFALMTLPPLLLAENDTDEMEDPSMLDAVRDRIQSISSDLLSARSRSEKLQQELRRTEIAIGRESLKLKEIDGKIKRQNDRLRHLATVLDGHEQTLAEERRYLAMQVRSAYMAGRSNYLKLLLNQEDPAKVGRVLAYYDYYNRARIASIYEIKEKVDLINTLTAKIESETQGLEKLKAQQLAKNRELAAYRESRNMVLVQLETDIAQKDLELQKLLEQEQKLSALLNKLEQEETSADFFEDIPPFGTLKGQLDWPAKGKLLTRFGSERRAGNLKWQGVKIGTDAGKDVRAIHSGRVLFADWFRNLGLLIILDHGEGYMSLYGYNQSLLKKPGDWVLAGETIAYAGNSGGQDIPGVYFEIRHNGKPLNPSLWCKR